MQIGLWEASEREFVENGTAEFFAGPGDVNDLGNLPTMGAVISRTKAESPFLPKQLGVQEIR